MCRHGSFERILIFLTESSPIALIMVIMMMMGDCLKFYEYSFAGHSNSWRIYGLCVVCTRSSLRSFTYILLLIGPPPPDILMIKFRLRGENVHKVFGKKKKKKSVKNNWGKAFSRM